MTRYIAIASGKGGAGKTTTAINLAVWLHHYDIDTTIIDANLSAPNVALHLGLYPLHATLHDVLERKKGIQEATYIHPSGLKVVPSSIDHQPGHASLLSPQRLTSVLLDLIGKTKYVILDTPPGLADESLACLAASDETIIVTNPEQPAIKAALKTIKIAEQQNSTVIGIILNRVHYSRHEIPVKEAEAQLERPILAIIPEDIHIKKSLYYQQPAALMYPDSRASLGFKNAVQYLI